ncbi:DNA-binding transcriptional regulator OxyR [Colwellia sp. D2M02]|uniref:DNA-binding transcriptional regulator OxyR n=1 Tax=Colwellia asteriadis TaxID=517723 RepID=A0ABN1L4P6_9GAMM|nr:DNA-binding transcriptional regulator OxyR [Colwellia sp. D2M02]MBU2893249.1 DNA-binding transcriptional regulator OxyR [Colwellia sp. D2M02]
MIKLRDLEYLSAIDEHKHFGQAAQACFVSQPTLSGQLMKLEQQLGLQLVERHRRNVMLTPAGEQLVKDAHKVLQAANDFERSAKALLDPFAGDLHVGLIPTLAPYLLPHIMSGLNKTLPNIKFYLHENQTKVLLEQLDQGKLDVLVLPYLSEMEKFDAYDLFDEPLILATPKNHRLVGKKQLELNDLHGEKILTLADGHCLKDQAMGYCFAAGANEDTSFQATSLETLRYMVGSGMGITLLPALAAYGHAHDESIHYGEFKSPAPIRGISLLVRPNYSRMVCVRKIVASIRDSLNDVVN